MKKNITENTSMPTYEVTFDDDDVEIVEETNIIVKDNN